MKLPAHKYYSLDKAAKLAGCEVSDLIHYAAIGVLEICIKIPPIELFYHYPKNEDADPELLKVKTDSIFHIDTKAVHENYLLDLSNEADNLESYGLSPLDYKNSDNYMYFMRFSYKSEHFSVIERYNVGKDERDIERWNGLLAIPSAFIDNDERELSEWDDWEISVCELMPPRCDEFSKSNNYEIGAFYIDGWYEISRNKMYITDYEYNLLINGGKYIYDSPMHKPSANKLSNDINTLKVNKRAERYAVNREKLLKSAIYILSKYPNECRGERKEISPEKWRDCLVRHLDEVPPLMITNEDVILKHLRSAANGKVDS
ncbi:hypothetical protein [Escherichia coli]|uniref:hypothetical protein n=1 Tax=Escherichia coli TaxID=562 RepID=UPI00226E4A1D|nr:hypothetical protein [Escherichia coli]MCX9162576.1 hypothetical protein [Escherichia coli]MCX9263183.1 hypothetical protein [Escherichia coli]MDZ9031106.1 hypothetical protein [Escherichia coli]